MIQENLFDSVASEAAKVAGMNRAAANRPKELEYARSVARQLAQKNGVVTADDVQAVLIPQGIELGNAAGSLFKKDFEPTGEYIRSARVRSHKNLLAKWRLKAA